jgi:trimeric autotransporter adhesin
VGGRVVRMVVSVGALVAVFVSSASAAGNTSPPDATCQTNAVVRSILYLNGVAYLAGDFTQLAPAGVTMGGAGTVTRHGLAACSESTGAIRPWNPGANGRVYSLAHIGSTIYVGGKFTTLAGKPRTNIGAVTTSGTATSFNPGAGDTVYVVRPGPNGNIFAGGTFGVLGGRTHARVGEVTPAGTPVSWNVTVGQVSGSACPPRCHPVVFTIAFSGSTVYFGGHFGLVNGQSRNSAAAVSLASGSLLQWNPNVFAAANCPTCQTVETERVYTLIPDATTNEVYACGGFWQVNGNKRSFNLAAFDPISGTLDPHFTVQDDGDTPGCALHNGTLYFGGHFNYVGVGCQHTTAPPCFVYHHVAAADVATNTVLAWNPGANSNHGIYTVRQDATHVGFGGYQTNFGGKLQEGYATYSTTLP